MAKGKPMRFLILPVLLALAALAYFYFNLQSPNQKGLSAEMRADFVPVSTQSCMNDARNRKLEGMENYCACAATTMADNLSEQAATQIAVSKNPKEAFQLMLPFLEQASKACQAHVSKKNKAAIDAKTH